jgi:hypothetical protein
MSWPAGTDAARRRDRRRAEGTLVLLLDGLDEAAAPDRAARVAAINAYRCDHGLVPMAVCSRTQAPPSRRGEDPRPVVDSW